jgi:hypothetical protein
MFEYILCEFQYGYEGQLYQEISNGTVVRLTDLNGNSLELQNEYGYYVIDSNPPRPIWSN